MNNDILPAPFSADDEPVKRIERFQSLQAGQYWRAEHDIQEECIPKGMVLLIKSIRWVEDKPHTIILRSHPSVFGGRQEKKWIDKDGHQCTTFTRFEEHRFLLDDFLAKFEFEPQSQQIRNREVQKAQERVQSIQTELMTFQSDPASMAQIVNEKLLASAPNSGSAPAAGDLVLSELPSYQTQVATSLATGALSGALNPSITEARVDEMKAAATRQHEIASIKSNWIQGKTAEIAEAIKAITPYYEEQAAAALAATEDVREYASKLTVGIQTLDLYVGRDVEVNTISEGPDAPPSEPLTFVQRKLFMDEELAVWADIDASFDFDDEEVFFEALKSHPELVQQIFPTERCIIGMATTRRSIEYGDAYVNMVRNDRNKAVFLLVRNGQNLHRIFSPVESHQGATRLFPSMSESDARFRGWDGTQVKFEDVSYTNRLAAHEAAALHYKRLLILICGLDHRLKLFGEFYPGQADMSVVSMKFQQEHCRFIHDDDQHTMLPGEKRLPLKEWIENHNANLRSGSRVLCRWHAVMNPTTAPGACTPTRDSFRRDYRPPSTADIKIAYKSGQSLCVDVTVSGKTAIYEDRTFNCKVNLSKYSYGQWEFEEFAYLCLDTVTVDDLHWYIHNRNTRMNQVAYIRLFKQALAHVRADLNKEAGTRRKMADDLLEGQICPASQIAEVVSNAVIAWRAANRGAELPSADEGISPRDWKSLLNQMYLICGHGKDKALRVQQLLESEGLEPLRLVSHGSSGLAVYATAPDNERDDRLWPHEWVVRIVLTEKKSGLQLGARRSVRLDGQLAAEATLHEWEGVATWESEDLRSAFPSFDGKRIIFDRTERALDLIEAFAVEKFTEEQFEEQFNCWSQWRRKANEKSKMVNQPALFIPFGVFANKAGHGLRYIGVGSSLPHVLLYKMAPTMEQAQRVRTRYVQLYRNKEFAEKRFESAINQHTPWQIILANVPGTKADLPLYVDDSLGTPFRTFAIPRSPNPLLAPTFDGWMTKAQKEELKVWIRPEVVDKSGQLLLDQLLGISLPVEYLPVQVFSVTIRRGDFAQQRWYVCPEGTTIEQLMVGEKGYGYSQTIYPTIAAARRAIEEMGQQLEGHGTLTLLQMSNETVDSPYIECYGPT